MPINSGEGRHKVNYRILNNRWEDNEREIDVHATPEEIRQLADEGYLIREKLFEGEALEKLRAGLDAIEEADRDTSGLGEGMSTSTMFGGLFLRHLMDKHPAYLELLRFPPTLSIARAMLGPLVQIRGVGARVSYPDQPNQQTHWHQHQSVISNPQPPWFAPPHALDCLIYLDDLNDANGPLAILPGSHKQVDEAIESENFDELPGQITLRLPAGSCVMMHGNLLHRALPTTPQGVRRRVVFMAYTTTWQKQAPYGNKPEHGLTAELLENDDGREIRELLGVGGYT